MTEAEFLSHLAPVHALIWFHARRLSRRRGVAAEDLYQSAAAELWASREKAAEHPAPSKWFAQAAVWAMLRHLDRQARHPLAGFDPVAHAAAFAALDPPPDEWETLVGFLDPAAAELVRRRFADDLTYGELAGELGITAADVRSRVETALDRIRQHLTP